MLSPLPPSEVLVLLYGLGEVEACGGKGWTGSQVSQLLIQGPFELRLGGEVGLLYK